MSEIDVENQIQSIAKQMNYPNTPDISGHVILHLQSVTPPRFFSRRLVWSLTCLLYTSPSPRDGLLSRMPSSA